MHRKRLRVEQLLKQITQMLRQWHFFSSQTAGTIKRTMKNNTERSSFLPHVYTLQQTDFGTSGFKHRRVHCGSTEGEGALTESLRSQQPSKWNDLSAWMWQTEGQSNHPPRPISKLCLKALHQICRFMKGCSQEVIVLLQFPCCKPVNKGSKTFSSWSVGGFHKALQNSYTKDFVSINTPHWKKKMFLILTLTCWTRF